MDTLGQGARFGPPVHEYAAAVQEAFLQLLSPSSPQTTELLFVRHGEAVTTAPQQDAAADPALTENGRRQAELLAGKLAPERIVAIYTSTSRASLETAATLSAVAGIRLVEAPELRDIDSDTRFVPECLGRAVLIAGIKRRFIVNPRWDALPAFEPSHRFRRRIVQAVEAIIACHGGKKVVLVTHHTAINAYLSMVLGIERDMFFLPEPTSVSRVRIQDDLYAVQNLNDNSHIPAPAPPEQTSHQRRRALT